MKPHLQVKDKARQTGAHWLRLWKQPNIAPVKEREPVKNTLQGRKEMLLATVEVQCPAVPLALA